MSIKKEFFKFNPSTSIFPEVGFKIPKSKSNKVEVEVDVDVDVEVKVVGLKLEQERASCFK